MARSVFPLPMLVCYGARRRTLEPLRERRRGTMDRRMRMSPAPFTPAAAKLVTATKETNGEAARRASARMVVRH
jgi:hypothetical protein